MGSRFAVIPGVRKIAVLRANGLGDLMFALPALEALRHAYPRAEIVLLACDWHRQFLDGRPGPVNRVEPVPPTRGVREDAPPAADPAAMSRFFQRMRDERFDLAVQMHGGGRYSNPFVLRLGAEVTVGLRTPDAVPLDRWVPYVYFQPEIIRYLEVVSLAGATGMTFDPAICVTAQDVDESVRLVPRGPKRFAVLNPSARDPRRRWPAEKFAATGRALRSSGFDVFVTGLETEAHLVHTVVESMRAPGSADLSGRLSLGGLAGLLSRAAVVVSNDSGPLHLGAAVGAPTVGIYWLGNLITAAPVTRSRHRPVMSWRLSCPRCGADAIDASCKHADSFVGDVSVEEVTAGAFDVMAEAKGRGETRGSRAEARGGGVRAAAGH